MGRRKSNEPLAKAVFTDKRYIDWHTELTRQAGMLAREEEGGYG